MDIEKAAKQASEVSGQPGQGSFHDAGCEAAREKRFGECGLEEKVERLRNVLRAHEHRLDSAVQLAVEAHELAHEYSHDPMGRVMKLARDTANKPMRSLAGSRRSPLD